MLINWLGLKGLKCLRMFPTPLHLPPSDINKERSLYTVVDYVHFSAGGGVPESRRLP